MWKEREVVVHVCARCYGYVRGGYGINSKADKKPKNIALLGTLFYYIYLLDEEATLCRMCGSMKILVKIPSIM